MKILLDTDPGVDDALALGFLASQQKAALVGISTVFGNNTVETTSQNALALCELFGIGPPVARGASHPIAGEAHPKNMAHGENGLGNVVLGAPNRPLHPQPAHDLMSQLARTHSGELVIVAIGPLTNLALTLQHDPEIVQHVRGVVVMGGVFDAPGNATQWAENNIYADPVAADRVFAADWPVTVVPLNITRQVVMDNAYLAGLNHQKAGRFLFEMADFYKAAYTTRLANAGGGIMSHDPTAAVCALDESPFTFKEGEIHVVKQGEQVGRTVLNNTGTRRTQRVAVTVNAERVLQKFLLAFSRCKETD